MLFRPVRHLADRINVLQRGVVAATRVFKIIDSDDNVHVNGTLDLNEVKGEVVFKDVNFSIVTEELFGGLTCLDSR